MTGEAAMDCLAAMSRIVNINTCLQKCLGELTLSRTCGSVRRRCNLSCQEHNINNTGENQPPSNKILENVSNTSTFIPDAVIDEFVKMMEKVCKQVCAKPLDTPTHLPAVIAVELWLSESTKEIKNANVFLLEIAQVDSRTAVNASNSLVVRTQHCNSASTCALDVRWNVRDF